MKAYYRRQYGGCTLMQQSQADAWTANLRELWRRIERHDFEPGQPLNFIHRFATHIGWKLDAARAAVEEYRRFCFLAAATSEPVTPSEEVDEVWHFHLTYTSDYWEVWCRTVLCHPLHHYPTRGDPDEDNGFRSRYATTLARYERFFGPPPAEFWPSTHTRFTPASRFRTIDAQRWIVFPRPSMLWRRIGMGRTP
jgi:hypothetical protein